MIAEISNSTIYIVVACLVGLAALLFILGYRR